jgi:hypothetical protein
MINIVQKKLYISIERRRQVDQNKKLKIKIDNSKKLNAPLNIAKITCLNNTNADLIIIHCPLAYSITCGGIVVLFNLAKQINNYTENIKIYVPYNVKKLQNPFFNNYFEGTVGPKDIVIYSEGIKGNPLNAKKIVRWILAEVGMNCNKDIYKTWNKNDLVYYFNPEQKFIDFPEKVDTIYKKLTFFFLNPKIINNNNLDRIGYCYTLRKVSIHKEKIIHIHPSDALFIKYNITHEEAITIFNNHKYFICYDPLTFLGIISILCGCITIIYPIKNVDKLTWMKTTPFWDYIENNNLNNFYGLAYGIDDLEFAKSTLHLADNFIRSAIDSINNKYVNLFIQDLKDFNQPCKLINTVQNNFFI